MVEPRIWWRMPGESTLRTLRVGEGDDRFVFAPFDEGARIVVAGRAEEVDWSTVSLTAEAIAGSPAAPPMSEHAYKSAIAEALAGIQAGDFDKVVVSRHAAAATAVDPVAIFRAKAAQYPDAFVYLWSHEETGVWLGATPELLVASAEEPAHWQTVSLAGTLRLNGGGETWTEKERNEQAVVTRYISNRLTDSGADSLQLGGTDQLQYGDIAHLQTPIRFRAERSLLELAGVLHPTPAVAGTPLAAAQAFIRRVESGARRYYSGYLGWMQSPTKGALFVNLRCMSWHADGVIAYAGAGIVAGSDPDLEWLETEAKLDSIRNILIPSAGD